MKKLILFFVFLSCVLNAQSIDIKILDYSTNLSIDDADIYFTKSRKNFVSDNDGKVVINLDNINSSEELIVSKKDYQNARIKVSSIKNDLIIKLEKISNVELQEAVVKNMDIKQILKKVIENYEHNFNVDKYYFLVNYQQESKVDTAFEESLDVDLQFKFNEGKIKVKSKGKANNKFKRGFTSVQTNFESSEFLKHLYLSDGLKAMNDNFLKNKYSIKKLVTSKYAGKTMFEIYLDKGVNEKNYLLIDKETFSVVQYVLNIKNELKTTDGPLKRVGQISFKYRPYLDGWVLKESDVKFTMTLRDVVDEEINVDLEYKINAFDFSEQPFTEFKKSVSMRTDIANNF